MSDIPEKIAHYVYDVVARYGESIGRPIAWSFLTIFLFSLILAWIGNTSNPVMALSWILSHSSKAILSLLSIMGR